MFAMCAWIIEYMHTMGKKSPKKELERRKKIELYWIMYKRAKELNYDDVWHDCAVYCHRVSHHKYKMVAKQICATKDELFNHNYYDCSMHSIEWMYSIWNSAIGIDWQKERDKGQPKWFSAVWFDYENSEYDEKAENWKSNEQWQSYWLPSILWWDVAV